MTFNGHKGQKSLILPALVLGIIGMGIVLSVSTMLTASNRISRPTAPASTDFVSWTPREGSAAFTLDAPEFSRAAPFYRSETLSSKGAVRDILRLGDDRKFIRLTLQQHVDGHQPGFFLEMARRSADAGLGLVKVDQPQISHARLGRMEYAEALLSGPEGKLACIGIRLSDHVPDLLISGFVCGLDGAVDAEKVACLVDRLDLKERGSDTLDPIFSGTHGMTACKTMSAKPMAQFTAPSPAPVKILKVKKH